MKKNILITGLPHSGKSTILKQIISSQSNRIGFVTNEVLGNGKDRIGFEIEAHSGKKTMLASVNFDGGIYVSRYGVSIKNLEALFPEVNGFSSEDLLYLDEIGQMQLYSKEFEWLVRKYLNSPNTCLATLSQVFTCKFIEEIRAREDIVIVEITPDDRSEKQEFIQGLIRKIIKARKYLSEPSRFMVKDCKAIIMSEHATRHLDKRGNQWFCDCDFFQKNKICSHWIALDEFIRI